MKDRVPLYPGRVIMTPVPGQANTFDMVRADEPQEVGTPLNKANLFTDETAQAFGLSEEEAFPDMGFRLAAKTFNNLGNIHIWSIEDDYGNYEYVVSHERDGYQEGGVGELPADKKMGPLQTDVLICTKPYGNYTFSAEYTEGIDNVIVAEDGALSLKNATSILFYYHTAGTNLETLKGKFISMKSDTSVISGVSIGKIYYIPEDAVFTNQKVNDISSLTVDKLYEVIGIPKREEFFYRYLGKIGDALNITIGTYTGDGTEKRKISLPFNPRAVLIARNLGQFYIDAGNLTYIYGGLAVEGSPVYLVADRPAIETTTAGFIVDYYYWTSSPYRQNATNANGIVYNYIALR